MRKFNNEEWFPVVDEQGNTISKAPRSICHDGNSKLLHPVVHLHLFNSSGRLFLQKRSLIKDIQPGKWDTSVGGHVAPGETNEEALIRETEEEIGLKDIHPEFICKYVWVAALERELVNSFIVMTDEVPDINKEEIEEGKFWALPEIKIQIGKGIFTPNFEYEFGLLSEKFLERIRESL